MKEKLSAWKIREQFPRPAEATCGFQGDYCVGGALSLFLARKESPPIAELPFPNELELSDTIQKVNPDLTPQEAYSYAEDIIFFNDKGEFEKAWEILQKALQEEEYINVYE